MFSVDRVRRSADQKSDLWTLFNRVQENTIKGGIHYTKEVEILDVKGNPIGKQLKNGTTRSLSSVDKTLSLNKTLWEYAVKLIA